MSTRRETPEDRAHIPDEAYADAFAMALLIPEREVRREWRKWEGRGADEAVMAYIFDVPLEYMVRRLRDLGLRP